ncbi:aquaporin-9-like [Heterodontus francisci]|uniref:aquaporin-9-like n=1 Tax=Heterodontus francisci TaxID=7792 RepID=UPI00355AD42A
MPSPTPARPARPRTDIATLVVNLLEIARGNIIRVTPVGENTADSGPRLYLLSPRFGVRTRLRVELCGGPCGETGAEARDTQCVVATFSFEHNLITATLLWLKVTVATGDRPLIPFGRAINKASSGVKQFRQKLRIKNQLVRECMAEFLGEYMLIVRAPSPPPTVWLGTAGAARLKAIFIQQQKRERTGRLEPIRAKNPPLTGRLNCRLCRKLFGSAAVAQVVTNFDQKGTYLSINAGYAIGVLFGVYVSIGVSGAHLNPAVSLCLCVLGRFPWKKLPFYTLAECLGSFTAAATTFCLYYDAIQEFSQGNLTVRGPRGTAGLFATYPVENLSVRNGFITEVIGTAVLLICILAIGDAKNAGAPAFLQPPLVAISVFAIGIGLGANTGYAINPARDLGPRLFTFVAGWGTEVFTAGNGWWWIPIVAPPIGGLLGTLVYVGLIQFHHEDAKSVKDEDKEAGLKKEQDPEQAEELSA